MTTTTINVYFVADSSGSNIRLAYFPNNAIRVPPNSSVTVIWSAIAAAPFPAPQFDTTSVTANGVNKDKITIQSVTTTSFVAVINNNTSDLIDAGVSFSVANPDPRGGYAIMGDSTIRNKGTSIFAIGVREIFALAAGFVIGIGVGAVLAPIWFPQGRG